MIIEPRVRGFICTTAHPVGCAKNVREQIAYVLRQGSIPECPKRVAVLGCSTGYGLASRIVATFAGGAETIGVSLEREPTGSRTGSAGWYNNRAFEIEAERIGRSPLTLEGDAFSDEMKKDFIDAVFQMSPIASPALLSWSRHGQGNHARSPRSFSCPLLHCLLPSDFIPSPRMCSSSKALGIPNSIAGLNPNGPPSVFEANSIRSPYAYA